MDFISGEIIGIDKPLGWTSFDAVKRLRGSAAEAIECQEVQGGPCRYPGSACHRSAGGVHRARHRVSTSCRTAPRKYIAEIRLGAHHAKFRPGDRNRCHLSVGAYR